MKTKYINPIHSEGEFFKKVMGRKWFDLHKDIQNRFDETPEPGKPLCYRGTLDILWCSNLGKLLAFLTKPIIKGALMPYRSNHCPVDIQVYKKDNCPYLFKQRIYQLKESKHVQFTSHMSEDKPGEIMEYVGAGLGMKLTVFEKEGNLHIKSDGYFLKIGPVKIPMPSIFTPGKTYLTHINENKEKFRIRIDINHCLLGKMFIQEGSFYRVEN